MKLTDEQRRVKEELLKQVHKFVGQENLISKIEAAKGYFDSRIVLLVLLLIETVSSEKAWKEDAEMFKRLWEGEMDLRHQWMDEAYENKDKLSQAVEVLEWIRDAGTDYQSIKKAASFLSSLSQETEQ